MWFLLHPQRLGLSMSLCWWAGLVQQAILGTLYLGVGRVLMQGTAEITPSIYSSVLLLAPAAGADRAATAAAVLLLSLSCCCCFGRCLW